MPDTTPLTPQLGGATTVAFNVVVHSEHLVIDRLWRRSAPDGAWGSPLHTGDTAGDDRDDFIFTNVRPQQEVLYHLLIETMDAEASGDFDIEVAFTDGANVLPGGRQSERAKIDKGAVVVERLVRFQ